MVTKVNMHKAKTELSRLVERACNGEEIVICKAGKPYVMLEPYKEPAPAKRKLGFLKNKIWIAPDFDEEDQEIIDMFENSKIFPDEPN